MASDPDHQPEFCHKPVGEVGNHFAELDNVSSVFDGGLVMVALENSPHE